MELEEETATPDAQVERFGDLLELRPQSGAELLRVPCHLQQG